MKLKENFVLRQVSETWIVLPLGEEVVDFSGMLKLNESGAMLWEVLRKGGGRQELVQTLTDEYEVGEDVAQADVDAFLAKLQEIGCLTD